MVCWLTSSLTYLPPSLTQSQSDLCPALSDSRPVWLMSLPFWRSVHSDSCPTQSDSWPAQSDSCPAYYDSRPLWLMAGPVWHICETPTQTWASWFMAAFTMEVSKLNGSAAAWNKKNRRRLSCIAENKIKVKLTQKNEYQTRWHECTCSLLFVIY